MTISLDDLQQYREILREIDHINGDITSVTTSLPTTGRPSIGGHSSTPGDPTARKAYRIMELKERRRELIARACQIKIYADSIKARDVRACVLCHYINGYSWRETSAIVFKSNSASRAFSLVHDFFNQVGKEQ